MFRMHGLAHGLRRTTLDRSAATERLGSNPRCASRRKRIEAGQGQRNAGGPENLATSSVEPATTLAASRAALSCIRPQQRRVSDPLGFRLSSDEVARYD